MLISLSTQPHFRRAAVTALFATLAASPTVAFCKPLPRSLSEPTSLTHRPESTQHCSRQFATMSTSTTDAVNTEAATSEVMTPASKLKLLRERMAALDLDVYLIPSDDPHLSEYVPAAYERREFMTGFAGSAGTAVVSQDAALLWTDSRYWNAANMELDATCWKLMKQGQPKVLTIVKHLGEVAAEHYKKHQRPLRVGIDPYVHPASFAKEFKEAMNEAAKTELDIADEEISIGELETANSNLVDPIWGPERPAIPTSPFRVHPIEYAGVSVADKVGKVRKEMETKKATLAVFSTLDDVAYLFNVRAMGDVETCPIGIAYATVAMDEITLYCDSKKIQSPEVKEHLSEVTLKGYDDIVDDIRAHCEAAKTNKVWLDTSRANYALSNVVPQAAIVDSQNAITPMKACKNNAELEGMRQAHIVDGVAMAKFMAWLEDQIVVQGRSVSEVEIDQVLTGFRAEQPGFLELSFPTIAGVGSNAAIIHYRAKEDSLMKHLDTTEPILIDSGGQYTYGTTDVTRTWHFGTPSEEFKELYSRVLKGNIAVDTMTFPESIPGFVLDVFARKSLWDAQKDYGHGTGHGVGAALNVHEGPFGISPRFTNLEGLKKGMVVSNEPGFYDDGRFGIRIENLLEMQYVNPEHNHEPKEDEEGSGSSEKKFIKFAKLTMIPIQKNLISLTLMSDAELDWLDAYHEEVFAKISPLLESDSPAMKWLQKSCEKIDRSK